MSGATAVQYLLVVAKQRPLTSAVFAASLSLTALATAASACLRVSLNAALALFSTTSAASSCFFASAISLGQSASAQPAHRQPHASATLPLAHQRHHDRQARARGWDALGSAAKPTAAPPSSTTATISIFDAPILSPKTERVTVPHRLGRPEFNAQIESRCHQNNANFNTCGCKNAATRGGRRAP